MATDSWGLQAHCPGINIHHPESAMFGSTRHRLYVTLKSQGVAGLRLHLKEGPLSLNRCALTTWTTCFRLRGSKRGDTHLRVQLWLVVEQCLVARIVVYFISKPRLREVLASTCTYFSSFICAERFLVVFIIFQVTRTSTLFAT